MSPKNGGKIELKLETSSASAATYAALLQTSSSSHAGNARVGEGAGPKQVDFAWTEATSAAPPEWLLDDARAALKAALRSAQASAGRWPRRITRWRPEPEG
jgi:hypothetical protein